MPTQLAAGPDGWATYFFLSLYLPGSAVCQALTCKTVDSCLVLVLTLCPFAPPLDVYILQGFVLGDHTKVPSLGHVTQSYPSTGCLSDRMAHRDFIQSSNPAFSPHAHPAMICLSPDPDIWESSNPGANQAFCRAMYCIWVRGM